MTEEKRTELKDRLKNGNQPVFFKWILRGSAIIVLAAGGVLAGAGTFGVALPAWVALTCSVLVSVGAGTGITSYLTKE